MMSELSGLGQPIVEAIESGEFDAWLNEFANAIRYRREHQNLMKRYEWKVGDRVVFNSRVHPKYLYGEFGTLMRFRDKKVTIRLDRDCGRFRKGTDIVTPVDIIDRVSSKEVVRSQVDAIVDKYEGKRADNPGEVNW